MKKALIFDFDGVLASSDAPRFKALQSFSALHGVAIGDEVPLSGRGKATQQLLMELLPNNPELIDLILNEFKTYRENITEYVTPIEFTVNYIRNYQGSLPIAIASMSSKPTIERLCNHFGIFQKITYIVSKNEVTHHKPNPEIYLKAAADLNVDHNNCLVFEDSIVGFQAARNANMQCSIILNGENNKDEFAAMDVYSFIATEQELIRTVEIFA